MRDAHSFPPSKCMALYYAAGARDVGVCWGTSTATCLILRVRLVQVVNDTCHYVVGTLMWCVGACGWPHCRAALDEMEMPNKVTIDLSVWIPSPSRTYTLSMLQRGPPNRYLSSGPRHRVILARARNGRGPTRVNSEVFRDDCTAAAVDRGPTWGYLSVFSVLRLLTARKSATLRSREDFSGAAPLTGYSKSRSCTRVHTNRGHGPRLAVTDC